jgi:threonine synthase
MKYFSTNGNVKEVSFREALLKGLAPDGGLFMPDNIPVFSKEELKGFTTKEYHEIASEVISRFSCNEIPRSEIEKLCTDAYNFSVPLEKVTGRKYILRLDQGPTASFKDFAARMMSRLMQYFLSQENRYLTILTATSGDTGSAVANAFYGLGNINVIILFPLREVTEMQRKQMTTLQKNVRIIAVDGKFDDCQNMVKRAFLDADLSGIPLSSANSINIGRLIPQSVYYIYSWSRLARNVDDKVVFSVPSGNFGDLTAGLLAARMGLPVERFIVATNSNDEVPEFLKSGIYKPIVPSKNCISSAMNVGHPSNLSRMVDLYGGNMDEKGNIHKNPDMKKMSGDLFGVSVSDETTRQIITEVFNKYNVLLEPHGAVAWKGIQEYMGTNTDINGDQLMISLETAHPAKFSGEIENVLNLVPELPESMSKLKDLDEKYDTIDNNYSSLKEILIKA